MIARLTINGQDVGRVNLKGLGFAQKTQEVGQKSTDPLPPVTFVATGILDAGVHGYVLGRLYEMEHPGCLN